MNIKDLGIIVLIVVLGACAYALTLRGDTGNPTPDQFRGNLDQATRAFELSPERGRYAHVATLAETGRYELNAEWADVVYPDIGISPEGQISSYFAPGVAYLTVPAYRLGAHVGLAQVATFAVESLVSIITLVCIYVIARHVFGLAAWAAFFAVLAYAFASASWTYAITLYQNAFTAMFITTGFYAVWAFDHARRSLTRFFSAAYVWLAYALAIAVDYPNAVLMLPVMIYLAVATFPVRRITGGIGISVRWSAIAGFAAFVLITGLHFWHNATYYGSPTRLAGELQHYIPEHLLPVEEAAVATSTSVAATTTLPTDTLLAVATTSRENAAESVPEKSAVGFFREKSMPNGLYILLTSDQRGLLFFFPLFALAIVGITYALRDSRRWGAVYIVPMALIAVNVFLYSAWGDPWGGWAYGPRYLIASTPWLALFVGVAIAHWRPRVLAVFAAWTLFTYSAAIALLGALTTNAVPPRGEAEVLGTQYNFLYNIPFLFDDRAGSWVYKTFFAGDVALATYFLWIYASIVLIASATLLIGLFDRHHHD